MELYQLKYFLCAARYENISKAAQVLRVTQPSVSKAIMALEKELQTELFVRSGKRIVLSYAGRTLRDRMMPVIAEMDDIFGDLHRLEDKKTIKLNLISANLLMSEAIARFRALEPDVNFVVTDRKEKRDWDLTICSSLPELSYSHGAALLEEEICLACAGNSRLAGREGVSLEELKDETFVLLLPGTVMREIADRRFRELGFIPRTGVECDALPMVWGLVEQNAGVALWPRYSWGKHGNVHLVRLQEGGFTRTLYMLKKEKELSAEAERFAAFTVDWMKQLAKDRKI